MAAAVYGLAAGLLVFPLLGLGTEAGVVETQAVAVAASGRPWGGRTAAARLVACGPFPAEWRGGAASPSEGRVRSRRGRGGFFRGLVLPDLVAALNEVLRLPECPWVDQVPDVVRQLGLDLLHCGRLQSGEVVPHDGGPCVAAHRIVQPSTHHLGNMEAVGAQEDVLQLLVRVAVGGGVLRQWADGGDQREREFRQRPVELRELLPDFGGDEHRVDAVEPCLGQVGVEVGQADCGGSGGGLLLLRWRHG